MGEQQRGSRHRDRGESVATALFRVARPGGHQRVVGPWEGDAVDDHEVTGLPRHVDPLPQRQRAEQDRSRITGEAGDKIGHGVTALLHEHGHIEGHDLAVEQSVRQGLGEVLGGALDPTPRREQREGAAARGGDEVGELVHRSRVGAIAPRGRHRACDVQDSLPRIVEWRSDVEARPRRGR